MNPDPAAFVLDSFALLAYLNGEKGMERVREVLRKAVAGRCRVAMSLINLGEVLYIVERECGLPQAQLTLAVAEQLPIEIVPPSRETVLAAAHIKANFRLSYADAFAVALAQEKGATILSGDPEFREVEGILPVEWLAQERRE